MILARNSSKAAQRLRVLSSILNGKKTQLVCAKASHDGVVKIGETSIPVQTPKIPQYVPFGFVPPNKELPQSVIRHLKWMAQKDLLGQDIFLIGPPGPLRRLIAMQYLEIARKEFEFITLSRDTTESDLKQRREIKGGTSYYIDQCAVKAATMGRVLVVEGVEKAERNVLPALNNLLENREMQLEDGRFLMHPTRYDALLEEHSKEELDMWQLVRVSENFRVIALGLPVPKYRGNPLDPPLRSRFQARDIYHLSFKDQLEGLYAEAPAVSTNILAETLSCATTLITQESGTLGLPDFPIENLPRAVKILNKMPSYPLGMLFSRMYPYQLLLNKEGRIPVVDTYDKFDIKQSNLSDARFDINNMRKSTTSGDEHTGLVDVSLNGAKATMKVPVGHHFLHKHSSSRDFIMTPYHNNLLADIMLSHSVMDLCIIGGKGCGKSAVVKKFADMLGYITEPVLLYQDMTSRDLLQQRYTMPNGDTVWRDSPLVQAALLGRVAVIDGLHRVNPGTLAVLQRLVHDREITLHDGTRLLRHDKYDTLKEKLEIDDQEMLSKSVKRIHPSFRMIALAEPPKIGSTTLQWLNPEMLTMFLYHHMQPLTVHNEMAIIEGVVRDLPPQNIKEMLNFCNSLRGSTDMNKQSLSSSLSTRQLLRISKRLAMFPGTNSKLELISDSIHKACLSRFLPNLAKNSLMDTLENNNLPRDEFNINKLSMDDVTSEVHDGMLRIGRIKTAVYPSQVAGKTASAAKVPDVLFYDNPQHLSVMEDMLKDYLLGEHILLVGNQGVGKNKIVDRFLHLLNKPREYLQLHRDTTVQSLTVQPTVKDGTIVYEDSPLVRAVRLGHALVVDEADKAPTHVTCVLKNLLESGRATLADGRKIISDISELENLPASVRSSEDVIMMHKNFRMFVLANRPGFPFLGNDFFAAMGDIFSCHAVDNPSVSSELDMLRKYGSNVPEPLLRKLVGAFGELRSMADQGLINYPYSTREVVNIVKHLQEFPEEGLANVVRNVFDFDAYSKETREQLASVMHKHGIPVGAKPHNIILSKDVSLPRPKLTGYWSSSVRDLKTVQTQKVRTRTKGPVYIKLQDYPLEVIEDRGLSFSEQKLHFQLPNFEQISIVSDAAICKGETDLLFVTTVNAAGVYSHVMGSDTVRYFDLYDVFPNVGASGQACIKIAPLGHPIKGQALLFEEKSNSVLVIDSTSGSVRRLIIPDLDGNSSPVSSFFTRSNNSETRASYKLCSTFSNELNSVVIHQINGSNIFHVDALDGEVHLIKLPMNIQDLRMVAHDVWLVTEEDTNRKFLLEKSSPSDILPCVLKSIDEEGVSTGFGNFVGGGNERFLDISSFGMSNDNLSVALDTKIESPNRIVVDNKNYAKCIVGFPELSTSEVYSFPRENKVKQSASSSFRGNFRTKPSPALTVALPDIGQVARILPVDNIPESVFQSDAKPLNSEYSLEVADLKLGRVRYIPLPNALFVSPYISWYKSISESGMQMTAGSDNCVYTIDSSGCVRQWQTDFVALKAALAEWRSLIGSDDDHIQITTEKESGKDVTAPKHGKVDKSNAPHVGGNTWAGGTGGRDTAGLGGKGGPYRLDAGHDVTQIPDWEKEAVPQHVKKAAREMAKKAFQERLKEIRMSEYDAQMYEEFSGHVRRQVKSLRIILDSLQAKGKERQWQKHQTTGELDDMKLIEGLTGEKNIYKRRADQEPEPGTPQQKPKRIRLVVDVSGSMYRFNGVDGRLHRTMEAMCMVMEAFEGYEDKLKFDIYGHSGDGFDISLVSSEKPPKNNKQRLEVMKTMHAHSQFCMSGDHTLEATEFAIKDIKKEEADEYIVIMLSDANLERYGIRPSRFTEKLNADDEVNAFAIFIGSLGDQAERLKKQLPAGKSFVCMDTKNIPQIMQQIFTSTVLR